MFTPSITCMGQSFLLPLSSVGFNFTLLIYMYDNLWLFMYGLVRLVLLVHSIRREILCSLTGKTSDDRNKRS